MFISTLWVGGDPRETGLSDSGAIVLSCGVWGGGGGGGGVYLSGRLSIIPGISVCPVSALEEESCFL